ncbi:dr1-associated corepressor isoform X1 [Dendroctonus ponderosae]|uniref:dr1-associated corepressor isoform X1 n=1 Tax=Dendroctonus ponderosae TaxID=77166 RepID=UPI002034B2B5|nr:dr1-associated corepressor isoform X1 [Dendroctonus ponderosae]
MPSKKKKYNARFPAGRIKKIMQTDEEVGKVAQAVPVIISKALEMFIESLLKKSAHITKNRSAKTLTPSHMKQCILSESRFDFLKDLVKNIPDASVQEDNENNALADSNLNFGVLQDEPGTPLELRPPSREKTKESTAPSTGSSHSEQSSSRRSSTSRSPVIQFGSKATKPECSKFNFSVNSLIGSKNLLYEEPQLHIALDAQELSHSEQVTLEPTPNAVPNEKQSQEVMPPMVPLASSSYASSGTGDNLFIDEDYDN